MRSLASAAIRSLVRPAVLALALLPGMARAQDGDGGQAIHASLRVVGEHDDNVSLGSGVGPGEEVVDDYVLRVTPSVTLSHAFEQHTFELALDGDARRGTDSDLSDINADASASLHLKFEGGLEARLYDTYERTEFDQAVYFSGQDFAAAEVGVSKSDANTAGAELSFRPRRSRFAVLAGYQRRDEKYSYLGDSADQRDLDRVNGEVAMAIDRRWSVYGTGMLVRQRAVVRPEFEFDEQRFAGGLRFRGASRFSIFAEVGQQEIDFLDTAGIEEDGMVFRGGLNGNLSDVTALTVSVGRDAFREPEMQAVFSHTPPGGAITLLARRSTEKSFSRATAGRTFQATLFGGSAEKDLGQRLHATLTGTYFRIESDTTARQQDDKTLVVSASLEYLLRHWLRFGASYRHATRSADVAENEFESNRAGISVVFVY